jgi:hypothetical protein
MSTRDPHGDPSLDALHAALTAGATPAELTGQHGALAAYRAVTWDRRRGFWRPAVLATKLGVATAVGVLGLSGVATAAYTGTLPDTLQDVAHKAIKAPPAHAKGPDAKGPAAYGLCQAFVKDKDDPAKEARKAAERAAERAAEQAAEKESPKATPPGQLKKAEKANGNGRGKGKPEGVGQGNGNKPEDVGQGSKGKHSVAYRNLVQAAGGEDKLEAYCAKVRADKDANQSDDADESESPKAEKSAKPSTSPKAEKSAKPSTPPAPAKSAEPSASATPEPTTSESPEASPSS